MVKKVNINEEQIESLELQKNALIAENKEVDLNKYVEIYKFNKEKALLEMKQQELQDLQSQLWVQTDKL